MRCACAVVILLLAACGPVRHAVSPDLEQARSADEISRRVRLGDHREAMQLLDRELARGSRHPRLLCLKGRLLLADGGEAAAEQAVPWLEQAVAASPLWFEPRAALAEAYLRLGRRGAADAVFAEVDRLWSDHPVGPWGRAQVALLAGRNDDADRLLAEALGRDPAFTPALKLRAYVARQRNDADTQREQLERYLAQRPRDAEAHLELGGLYESANRLEDAKRAMARAWELEPAPHVAGRVAAIARRQGRADEAEAWDRRAGAAVPVDPGAPPP